MPVLKKKEKFGDLIATVQVQIPKKLTAKEKNLYEKLKEENS